MPRITRTPFTRQIAYEITKLQLSQDNPTQGLLQAIKEVKFDYPDEYLNPWFKNAHQWTKGKQDSGAGPGTQYMLGYLDAVKEMGYDISLVVEATKKWRSNPARENAINEWLTKNT